MRGRLEWVEVESRALEGNALGDPARRPLLLYLPPGHDDGGDALPAVYFLHGFMGCARAWLNVAAFQPTVPERLDDLVASGVIPPVIGVFVDGWTGLGGSQWMNSSATGRYEDYVIGDVVPAVDARCHTLRRPGARVVTGRSSGGYGALALGTRHPDVFGHVASHSADAGFEYCYLPDFPRVAAALGDADLAAWLAGVVARARATRLGGDDHLVLNALAMAAAYSPRPGTPLGLELPFEPGTARLRDDVWARWLEHDPVRFVPREIASLRRLRSVYLDCGTRDEFNLRWGARMIAETLRAGGVEAVAEEFEDGHRGVDYRFARSLTVLAPRLERT